ncbi:hypothetical protein [Streptomyces sp. ICC1]|uniref:hypothetical protein n=1 Tax=Streptomyces sp. ICC1 TaxID=2099583 RepID=UPI000DC7D21E|nr:hypothetical protein [Streptomyces sp. ICC1]AWZ03462.1 hypothetical protein DRB89_01145 [Streptomyces sp. ICC4]AWZ11265.1 hypothetical protein DRB96_01735 [Streptomyces sp. ICC1]
MSAGCTPGEPQGQRARTEQARLTLVLHTPAGGARYLATRLDSAPHLEVMGCIAGNDVTLVVCRSWDGARRVLRYVHGEADADR